MFSRSLIATLILVLAVLLPSAPNAHSQVGIYNGIWIERWNQEGNVYCPDNSKAVTTVSEPFELVTLPGETILIVNYKFTDESRQFIRMAPNTFVYTYFDDRWAHLLVVTLSTPSVMYVTSTFYSMDGSCTIQNYAVWSYAVASNYCTIWSTRDTNRLSGPGMNYNVVGQLPRLSFQQRISWQYSSDGILWWQLADYTWVSSRITEAIGYCN